ncbi:glycosyltransferase family protein [Arthrobacter roseus]|uniref:glycosyltransferase family protein n=1 Tax=Arthrobacter roseus TaxID=136274 RepID=UPI0030846B64|nr:spore maturation protein CgeB [Arthrobacter roseus]
MIDRIIQNPRQALWHLRKGGVKRVAQWSDRLDAEAGQQRTGQLRGAEGRWYGRRRKRRLTFAEMPMPEGAPRRPDLTVALIADDFSAMAFGCEWNIVQLGPNDWAEHLSDNDFDLLFVESVWHGKAGKWAGKVAQGTHSSGPLRELVTAFNTAGIPTVFWNKEDPPHYKDFLEAARLFDHVYTTDSNKLPDYQRDLGHGHVSVLAFGAQPVVHNPVRPRDGWHRRDVTFAGMYFSHKYPERRQQLDVLLSGAQSAQLPIGLEIFSRYLGEDEKYQFPAPYTDDVVGSLTYRQMLTAYKAYKIFLNVNSVTESPTMCSRRIFEVIASGSTLISTPSQAIETYFASNEICVAQTPEETQEVIRAVAANPRFAELSGHRGQRRIWREHTYAHRAEQVIGDVIPSARQEVGPPPVSVVVATRRPDQLTNIFENVGRQTHRNVELIVLSHGYENDNKEFFRLADKYGIEHSVNMSAATDVSLGECLNSLVATSSSAVVTKMDDDDYYGPHYLEDQLHAMNYSRADIVGKQAHYMYLESLDASILRFAHREHCFTSMVMGPTLMASRELLSDLGFADLGSGEDSDLLRRAVRDGASVYAADRFSFYQRRKAAGHTWSVGDHELLATGEYLFRGSPENEVNV